MYMRDSETAVTAPRSGSPLPAGWAGAKTRKGIAMACIAH